MFPTDRMNHPQSAGLGFWPLNNIDAAISTALAYSQSGTPSSQFTIRPRVLARRIGFRHTRHRRWKWRAAVRYLR
jgi:hypothetical protein